MKQLCLRAKTWILNQADSTVPAFPAGPHCLWTRLWASGTCGLFPWGCARGSDSLTCTKKSEFFWLLNFWQNSFDLYNLVFLPCKLTFTHLCMHAKAHAGTASLLTTRPRDENCPHHLRANPFWLLLCHLCASRAAVEAHLQKVEQKKNQEIHFTSTKYCWGRSREGSKRSKSTEISPGPRTTLPGVPGLIFWCYWPRQLYTIKKALFGQMTHKLCKSFNVSFIRILLCPLKM